MWFWWFMFFTDLLIPIILIVGGRIMWKRPPQKINGWVGYRTSRSMKNMDTWKFAHDFCGRLWWKLGWIILIPSAVAEVPFYNSSEDMIGAVGGVVCIIQCVILIWSIFPTEKALKEKFAEE